MKFIDADLVEDVVSSYDQTKTTVQGRAVEKTLNGKQVIGPPINQFVDIFNDAAMTPSTVVNYSQNNRLFTIALEAAGVSTMSLHNIDPVTLVHTYVGKINISLPDNPATTHVFRSLKVIDSGTTGWKLFLTNTATITRNAGTFLINNIDQADFVPVGFPTIPFGTGNNQKAVYLLEDPANIGFGQLQIASAGSVLDIAGNRLYVHNGVAATHQYYVYNTATAPTWASSAVTGDQATDVITDTGHAYNVDDQVVFTAITGGAGLVAGTVYYVRNPVAGVSYQLSLTAGGAVINFTTDITAGQVGRAYGITGSNFVHKTGNLPALTGVLLLTDSEYYALPQHTTNSGFDCAFFMTTTNLYLGRLSELTSGAVAWPSLVTSNILGSANEIVVPTPTHATWSNALDRAVFSVGGSVFIMKQVVNNVITKIFGGTSNKYLEGYPLNQNVPLGLTAVTSIGSNNGVFAVASLTLGQRGVILSDLRSDALFDYSYIVTKVLNTPNAVYSFLASLEEIFEITGSIKVQYRTSGFGSLSGGWIDLPFSEDISAFASGQQTQFKILFDTLALDTCIPGQIYEFVLGFNSLNEISDNWEYSHDDSETGNPARVAFRLKQTYVGSVPNVAFRAYDLSNVLVAQATTTLNPGLFEYSIDDGLNWNALGVVPNVVGTKLRYNFAVSPAVNIRPSLREA